MTRRNASSDRRIESITAEYLKAIEKASAQGIRIEVLAVHDGETVCWSVIPASMEVMTDRLRVDGPEGPVELPFGGPDAPAILPMLTPIDAAWRKRNSARREMRRMAEGHDLVQVTDGSTRILVDPAMVMVATCGIFAPHIQGMTWDETLSLHATGPVLDVRSAERTLSIG